MKYIEDNSALMVRDWMIKNLEGKLLTFADAIFNEKIQREAFKDIIKSEISILFNRTEMLPTGIVDAIKQLELIHKKENPSLCDGEYVIVEKE